MHFGGCTSMMCVWPNILLFIREEAVFIPLKERTLMQNNLNYTKTKKYVVTPLPTDPRSHKLKFNPINCITNKSLHTKCFRPTFPIVGRSDYVVEAAWRGWKWKLDEFELHKIDIDWHPNILHASSTEFIKNGRKGLKVNLKKQSGTDLKTSM